MRGLFLRFWVAVVTLITILLSVCADIDTVPYTVSEGAAVVPVLSDYNGFYTV